MLEKILELVIGQIPEAIYFALFRIYAKRLNEKRLIFLFMITVEYVALLRLFPYNLWSHIFFFIMTFLILKILYNEKSQITDIFTLGVASIILLVVSVVVGLIVWNISSDFLLAAILQKIVIFLILFLLKDKLYGLQNAYKNWWNRNDNIKKPIKSVTFRAVNVIIFNVMFAVINVLLIIGIMLEANICCLVLAILMQRVYF